MERDENGPQLFTASDVARFCQVDLKTIHNWSEKGQIRHFRTPGRHLRFRRLDVLDFLRKYGYPIPPQLRQGKPRVVVVDEDQETLSSLRRALGKRFDVSTFSDPFEALVSLGSLQPDALVLEPRMNGIDGMRWIERLKAVQATAHIRMIVYSANDTIKQGASDAGAFGFVLKGNVGQLRDLLESLTGVQETEEAGDVGHAAAE